MRHRKAVNDSENQLGITQVAKNRISVMTAIDKGETIKQEHNGRSKPIIPLHHQSHAKQTTCHQRNKEIKQHLAHPLVKGKGQIMPFRFYHGENEDG